MLRGSWNRERRGTVRLRSFLNNYEGKKEKKNGK